MKMMKKIAAIVLAIMMIAMVGLAYADPTTADMGGSGTEDGVIGEFTSADTPTIYNNYVILYKEITAFNAESSTVNAPTITYQYAIAPGAAGSGDNLKDAGGASLHATGNAVAVTTKAGQSGATISGATSTTGTYSRGELALTPAVQLQTAPSTAGYKNVFPLKVDFSGVTWNGAGVYRYIITETVNNATTDEDSTKQKNYAGIADGTSTNVRYLDVYVKDGTTAGTYEIYGYVCFQTLGDIDGTSDSTVTKAAKTEGFVTDNGGTDGNTELTADQYYTFNQTVSKTLVGDQAKNENDFPFYVNFKNSSVTAAISIKSTTSENSASAVDATALSGTLSATTGDPATLTGISDNPGIDHQSNKKYIGIPVGITAATTVDVYETNNVSGTTYVSTYKIDTADYAGTKSISWDSTNNANKSNTAILSAITANDATNTAHTIDFKNTLELISPTGYVSRFAPYALILVGGIVLLVIAMKRKGHKEEE